MLIIETHILWEICRLFKGDVVNILAVACSGETAVAFFCSCTHNELMNVGLIVNWNLAVIHLFANYSLANAGLVAYSKMNITACRTWKNSFPASQKLVTVLRLWSWAPDGREPNHVVFHNEIWLMFYGVISLRVLWLPPTVQRGQ